MGNIKFGAPQVVDMGIDLEHSPDGKLYIIGHGTEHAGEPSAWMQGSSVYMARCPPSQLTSNHENLRSHFFFLRLIACDYSGGGGERQVCLGVLLRGRARWEGSMEQRGRGGCDSNLRVRRKYSVVACDACLVFFD